MLPGFSGRAGQDLVQCPGAFCVLRSSAPTLFTFQPSLTLGVITGVTVVLGFRELQSINPLPQILYSCRRLFGLSLNSHACTFLFTLAFVPYPSGSVLQSGPMTVPSITMFQNEWISWQSVQSTGLMTVSSLVVRS